MTHKMIRLRNAIHDAGYMQTDIADKVGITDKHLSAIINGVKRPSVEVLVRIAEILHVKVDDLL